MDIREELYSLDSMETSIHENYRYGIINEVEVANQLNMIKQQKLATLKRIVTQNHVTRQGKPINWHQPPSMNGRWVTNIYENGTKKRLVAPTEEKLLLKILDYYNLSVTTPSVENLYLQAVEEKKRRENPDIKTPDKWKQYYKRYLVPLSNREIQTITLRDLEDLTKKLIDNHIIVTQRHFNDYKTSLNILYGYVCNEKHYVKDFLPNEILFRNYSRLIKPISFDAEEKIFSKSQIQLILDTIDSRTSEVCHMGYDYNGLAIKLSIYTGMRVGELVALRWKDVKSDSIHIHSQERQYKNRHGSGLIYSVEEGTKNEHSNKKTGRYFPIYDKVREVLDDIKEGQKRLGIESEWVICNHQGERTNADAYEKALRSLCKKLGLDITNNHALRMALNGYVLCEKVPNVAARASMLGHSVETNMKWYSYFHREDLSEYINALNTGVYPKCTP